MRLKFKLSLFSLGVALLLGACNLPAGTPNPAATLQAIYTAQAALTAQAGQGKTVASPTTASNPAFPTLPPVTRAPTSQAQPTALPPTQRPAPSFTPITYCNWAAFVDDITVPDGTTISPGTQFVKTWRLKNIGTCSWTTSYELYFLKGDYMGGDAVVHIPAVIDPGETVDISITLTAPTAAGSYRGYWVLKTRNGELFGLGGRASDAFYVDIQVNQAFTTVYKFTSNYCDAVWSNSLETLGCPGEINNPKGYVTRVDNVQMENGQFASGQSLLMVPQSVDDGLIFGIFPPFTIQNGDRFRARINCGYQTEGCDIKIELDYKIGDANEVMLWKYHEVYDGQYREVDTDLSPLEGKTVKFIFIGMANGSPQNDRLVWVNPRIDRLSNLVTPSPTPSITPTPKP